MRGDYGEHMTVGVLELTVIARLIADTVLRLWKEAEALLAGVRRFSGRPA